MIVRQRTTIALLTLALGTGITGTSAARPLSDPSIAATAICSEVCSGGAASYGAPRSNATAPAYSLSTILRGQIGPCSEVCSDGAASYGSARLNRHITSHTRPTVTHAVTHTNPFDWGDAGIGAAGALAVTMFGLGVALLAAHRRNRNVGAPRAS